MPLVKLTSPQALPLFVLRIFKIAGRDLLVESHFSKVTETLQFAICNSAFCNSVEKPNLCDVSKSSCSSNFEKSSFNRSCRLTVQANKDEHATKFVKGALKLTENF